ncbi:MAG: response regulator [Proteobacteria bacterium]|nr:response regulator [Pseudomonadota bacterium]
MKKRVLIVDDEATILPESRKLIQDHGTAIDVAETMEEALTLLNMREYEFVIVGLKFTNSLGEKELQILKRIKENNAMTGIVLLTGYGDSKVTEEALSIGAAYYYEKCVSTKVLRDVMKGLN